MRRYIKLHTVILTNDKVAGLSSDAARWHYAKLLLHAKQTEPEGRWRSMSLLRSSVGEDTFAYVPEFMSTEPEGLLVETEDGEIKVRQWWLWQGSDLNARKDDLGEQQQERKRAKERKKKATYRAKKKAPNGGPEVDVHHPVHQMSTNVHPNKERESLYEDGGHVRVLPDATVPPVSDSSMSIRDAIKRRTCLGCGSTFTRNPAFPYLDASKADDRYHDRCIPSDA